MTIDEMIAVLQAAKEGKKIQTRVRTYDDCGSWVNGENDEFIWDFHRYEYRVKPEPMEALLWFDKHGHQFTTMNISEKECESYKRSGYAPKKFREVIE